MIGNNGRNKVGISLSLKYPIYPYIQSLNGPRFISIYFTTLIIKNSSSLLCERKFKFKFHERQLLITKNIIRAEKMFGFKFHGR